MSESSSCIILGIERIWCILYSFSLHTPATFDGNVSSIVCRTFHSHHNSNHIFQRVRCVWSGSIWLLIFRWHFTAYTFHTSWCMLHGGQVCKHLNRLPQSRFKCILHIAQCTQSHTHILTRRANERTHISSLLAKRWRWKRTKPLNCCAQNEIQRYNAQHRIIIIIERRLQTVSTLHYYSV